MAGESKRFFQAGYIKPKFMLEAKGKTLFRHAVEGFHSYFNIEPFLFIVRDINKVDSFIKQECMRMGLHKYEVVILKNLTFGQGHTVYLGLDFANIEAEDPVTIFNIDTFRPGFIYPTDFDIRIVDGYLEVFVGTGANWSFVRPMAAGENLFGVAETSEKRPISNLCCTGLYYFRRSELFFDIIKDELDKPKEQWEAGELYIAPLYNRLIKQGCDIRYKVISRDEVIFCGVPQEYVEFCERNSSV